MVWLIAICIAISALTTLAFVPIVRYASHACGIVDQPDQERKLQAKPVALGGGLAVFIALVVGFVSTILIDRAYFGRILGDVSFNYYILFGAGGCLLLVGLIDDAWALRGRQKLLLQCLILFALVGGGTLIRQIGLFGYEIHLGVLAFPITVVWLLISVNALNLIDGADGVATTSGSIICIGPVSYTHLRAHET